MVSGHVKTQLIAHDKEVFWLSVLFETCVGIQRV